MGEPGMHLICCTAVIENEIAQGLTKKDIATTYALAIPECEWQVRRAASLNWQTGQPSLCDAYLGNAPEKEFDGEAATPVLALLAALLTALAEQVQP